MIQALPGFWRSAASSQKFHQCREESAEVDCPGSSALSALSKKEILNQTISINGDFASNSYSADGANREVLKDDLARALGVSSSRVQVKQVSNRPAMNIDTTTSRRRLWNNSIGGISIEYEVSIRRDDGDGLKIKNRATSLGDGSSEEQRELLASVEQVTGSKVSGIAVSPVRLAAVAADQNANATNTSSSSCPLGQEGPLCSVCSYQYSRLNGDGSPCELCPPGDWGPVIGGSLTFLFLVYVVCVIFFSWKKEEDEDKDEDKYENKTNKEKTTEDGDIELTKITIEKNVGNKKDEEANEKPEKNQQRSVVVTIPRGMHAGNHVHVNLPNGKSIDIPVPVGMKPGNTMTINYNPHEKEGKEEERGEEKEDEEGAKSERMDAVGSKKEGGGTKKKNAPPSSMTTVGKGEGKGDEEEGAKSERMDAVGSKKEGGVTSTKVSPISLISATTVGKGEEKGDEEEGPKSKRMDAVGSKKEGGDTEKKNAPPSSTTTVGKGEEKGDEEEAKSNSSCETAVGIVAGGVATIANGPVGSEGEATAKEKAAEHAKAQSEEKAHGVVYGATEKVTGGEDDPDQMQEDMEAAQVYVFYFFIFFIHNFLIRFQTSHSRFH